MDVKGKVIYATVALIFVLLVASTASALSITGNSNLSLCQCESAKIDLNVCATFAGTYNIVKSGTAAPWVLIAPTSLTLTADECQHLYAFVTPNCYAQASPYTVDFNFNGPEFGKATLGILVRQCHTSNFTITPLSSSSKPCQENTYDMSIKNTSNFADEYILSQTGLPDSWVSYNKDKFVVDAGQSYSTQLKVKSACSADAKTYAFAMKLSNTKTNNSSEVPLSQQIVGFVPFTSNISPSISSCSETDTNIYVRVTNHSDTNDVIALETDANYVTINTPSVNVSAGASVDVVLTVKKMQASHKDFNFKIYSNNFEKSYVTPISLTVNNCYGVSIQRITSDTNYCTGVVEQKFVIRNSGLADINGFLKLSGMNADLNTVSLVSGEEKEVVLKLNPDHAGHYDMNLDLISDNTNFTLPFSVNFETCTDANLLVPQVTLCAGAQPQRFLTIFNTGTKTQTFNLTTNAPGVTFESNTVTLEPASSQEVPIAFDPLASATGSYNITASSGSFSVSRALNVRVASNEECYSFETVASTLNLKKLQ